MIEIKHKTTGKVLHTAYAETLRGADLSGAYLSGADLSGAELSGADLSGAELSGADLRDANLRDANLSVAYLSGADLRGAYLRRAYLRGAYLRGAYLRDANLRDANLSGANLRDANLSRAYLRCANLQGAILPDAPVIPNIHQRVYEAASQPQALNMCAWHTCDTTHCRAGWVVTLAGDEGAELERRFGTSVAAALIYMASDPALEYVPDWLVSDDVALADMKRMSELEAAKKGIGHDWRI